MKADIGNWIWIILVLFGLISKFMKSGGEDSYEKYEGKSPKKRPQNPTLPDSTFEELLEEIERQKQASSPPPVRKVEPQRSEFGREPLPRREPVRKNEPEKRDTSRTLLDTVIPDYEDDTAKTYNEAIKSAFTYTSLESTISLEESLRLSDTTPTYKKFDEYAIVSGTSLAAQYAQDLRNPQDVKKAIVLSEILNRRF